MIEFELRDVYEKHNWKIVAVNGVADDITFTIHTDKYEPENLYECLRHLIELYECASEEITSDEHPVRGGFSIMEQGDSIIIELSWNTKAGKNRLRRPMRTWRKRLLRFSPKCCLNSMKLAQRRNENGE
jgi:hypothetical protein